MHPIPPDRARCRTASISPRFQLEPGSSDPLWEGCGKCLRIAPLQAGCKFPVGRVVADDSDLQVDRPIKVKRLERHQRPSAIHVPPVESIPVRRIRSVVRGDVVRPT